MEVQSTDVRGMAPVSRADAGMEEPLRVSLDQPRLEQQDLSRLTAHGQEETPLQHAAARLAGLIAPPHQAIDGEGLAGSVNQGSLADYVRAVLGMDHNAGNIDPGLAPYLDQLSRNAPGEAEPVTESSFRLLCILYMADQVPGPARYGQFSRDAFMSWLGEKLAPNRPGYDSIPLRYFEEVQVRRNPETGFTNRCAVQFGADRANPVDVPAMHGADLRGANLEGANLEGVDLRGADLRGANLQYANLERANLQGANLEGANLEGAYLEWAKLQGADLRGAYLRDAYLLGATLLGADLRGVDLRGVDLRSADLQGVNLRGAKLYWADLKGADLRGADLRDTDLEPLDKKLEELNKNLKELRERVPNDTLEAIQPDLTGNWTSAAKERFDAIEWSGDTKPLGLRSTEEVKEGYYLIRWLGDADVGLRPNLYGFKEGPGAAEVGEPRPQYYEIKEEYSSIQWPDSDAKVGLRDAIHADHIQRGNLQFDARTGSLTLTQRGEQGASDANKRALTKFIGQHFKVASGDPVAPGHPEFQNIANNILSYLPRAKALDEAASTAQQVVGDAARADGVASLRTFTLSATANGNVEVAGDIGIPYRNLDSAPVRPLDYAKYVFIRHEAFEISGEHLRVDPTAFDAEANLVAMGRSEAIEWTR